MYDRVLEIDSNHTSSNYTARMINKGRTLADFGKPEEAIEWYDKVLEINENDTDAMNEKAGALVELEKPEELWSCLTGC